MTHHFKLFFGLLRDFLPRHFKGIVVAIDQILLFKHKNRIKRQVFFVVDGLIHIRVLLVLLFSIFVIHLLAFAVSLTLFARLSSSNWTLQTNFAARIFLEKLNGIICLFKEHFRNFAHIFQRFILEFSNSQSQFVQFLELFWLLLPLL